MGSFIQPHFYCFYTVKIIGIKTHINLEKYSFFAKFKILFSHAGLRGIKHVIVDILRFIMFIIMHINS